MEVDKSREVIRNITPVPAGAFRYLLNRGDCGQPIGRDRREQCSGPVAAVLSESRIWMMDENIGFSSLDDKHHSVVCDSFIVES